MRMSMRSPKSKNLGLTILLAILVSGIGHVYLGYVKRGVIILIITIVFSFIVAIFLPFPVSAVPLTVYWIWQIYDVYEHYRKNFHA
jgi:TM2 domain-containing membrane protein YozV